MTLPEDVVHFNTPAYAGPVGHPASQERGGVPNSRWNQTILSTLGMTLGAVGIIGVAFFIRFQPTSISLSSDAFAESVTTTELQPALNTTSVPTRPQVAGATAQQPAAAESSFGVITATARSTEPAVLGVASSCALGTVFSIGQPEQAPADIPVDELGWADALDFVAPYSNPFVVGHSLETDFPWRTDATNADTHATVIRFSYAGNDATSELSLGWSPGKVGDKAKRVLLNGRELGTTPMRTGEFVAGWWEQMPRFVDSFPLKLTRGDHTLTIEHIASDQSDAAVWDFIQLKNTSCE
jgi:hypothetical protein